MADLGGPARRLGDLLVEPRETLETELKGWIDLGLGEHKALLAKALIALANHGGGFVLIGFARTAIGAGPAPGRPADLSSYTPDAVNSVVSRYAEPPFHCDVSIHQAPDGLEYPIVSVPGGHAVPIRSSRDGPDGKTIRRNSYYVRRAGPQSEVPQSGQEWDVLMRRVLSNAREDLLAQFRSILSGGARSPPGAEQSDAIGSWFRASMGRWSGVASALPEGHPALLAAGHFALGYRLNGDFGKVGLGQLRDALERATVRHTGWPEFLVPSRQGIAPYIEEGCIECWIARDQAGDVRDGAHSDFWRASPECMTFLIRGLQEDGPDYGANPGTAFDLTTPVWRVGEALLHASRLASELGDPGAEVTLTVEWTGLGGRTLTVHPTSNRLMFENRSTHQDAFRTTIVAVGDAIPGVLPELVHSVLQPLYELFDFFQLPPQLVAEELVKMRSNSF